MLHAMSNVMRVWDLRTQAGWYRLDQEEMLPGKRRTLKRCAAEKICLGTRHSGLDRLKNEIQFDLGTALHIIPVTRTLTRKQSYVSHQSFSRHSHSEVGSHQN